MPTKLNLTKMLRPFVYLTIVVVIVFSQSCNNEKDENKKPKPATTTDSIAAKLAEQYYDVSLYYATLPDYHLGELPISMGGPIVIGRGVKLVNAYNPILQNSRLVDVKTIDVSNPSVPQFADVRTMTTNNYPKLLAPPISDIRSTTTWDYFSDKSTSDKARALYANFSYDATFGSFEASYSFVEKFKQVGVFLMAQGTQTLTDTKLPINTSITPDAKQPLTKIDKLPNVIERSSKFFENYGSHYISEITYGYRFTFVARSESASKSIEQEASFKFQNLVASLSVSASDKQYFTNNKISISATIVGGYSEKPYIFLTSLEEIGKFIQDLNSGAIKLYYAPIAFRLKSYNHLIYSTEYPNLYNLTTPNLGQKASSEFGVPKGTIISWFPPDLGTLKTDNINITNVVPKGWALCDGTQGTPDLRDRFILGAIGTPDANDVGGAPTHNHGGETGGLASYKPGQINYASMQGYDATFQMRMSITPDNNMPPYRKILYIMKL